MPIAATAIQWNDSSTSNGSAANDPYWSGLEPFVERSDCGDKKAAMSYSNAFYLIAKLARLLQEHINQKLRSESKDSKLGNNSSVRSIPIAVAIPEGIYLPLAIAAVHALNRPMLDVDSGSRLHVVLVPLDPSDAPKRIISMLLDSWPCLILTAGSCDYERLEAALVQLGQSKTDDGTSRNSPLYRIKEAIQLLDIPAALSDVPLPNESLVFRLDEQLRRPKLSLIETLWECDKLLDPEVAFDSTIDNHSILSHICFTSGTTGVPKGCMSSRKSLSNYLAAKNRHHGVDHTSRVLLASSISFDPCLSDILATFTARATLIIASRGSLLQNLTTVLRTMQVTHCLCTPTLWSTTLSDGATDRPTMLYKSISSLQCVALGGERIPATLIRAWSRRKDCDSKFRFCATYGVTEACVYQTFGEVDSENCQGSVGFPFDGMSIRICVETEQERLVEVEPTSPQQPEALGEIVLYGNQLDELSSYLLRPDLAFKKFIGVDERCYYRTGDRGFLHPETNNLHIVGRIDGEDGMVKVNGVRTELSEVEAAVVDRKDDNNNVVLDCIAVADRQQEETTSADGVICFIVLSGACHQQLGMDVPPPICGAFCAYGPLLVLLRQRCKDAVKVMPSAFVVVPRIPLSPTGKRDRSGAPKKSGWVALSDADENATALERHGRLGKIVSDLIVGCLNLQPVQKSLLTTHATFGMAGGDSLAATRVTRTLYARHHGVPDSRFLGGEFGVLDGPFAARHLINARSLGNYVDWLDSNDVCKANTMVPTDDSENDGKADSADVGDELYVALFQAAAKGYSSIGVALLDAGADPTLGSHKGRLGKISSRLERKQIFRSSPLHLACIRGDSRLVRRLVEKGAAINSPDASGLFPLHLVAAGEPGSSYTKEEDLQRIQCLDALLQGGAPLSMKDGQKQTVIHAAARSGRQEFLRHVLQLWTDLYLTVDSRKADSLEWRDGFTRTAVHWAILNGHVESLSVLLEMGCSPDPIKLKTVKTSSLAPESADEMCRRLYGANNTGERIQILLKEYRAS